MAKSKHVDPIPEKFASIEEASDFWDTHDAGDYEEYLRPIPEGLEFVDTPPHAVLLEYSLLQELKAAASQRGVSLETLVNLWLKEKLLADH